jgi:EAL domain-containing protein (putative c-di-GMP-specific phosphodiesterase class I)
MRSAVEAMVQLQRLADLGVQLSIDDYGTGFSTLDYLKRIPASELKIDRSFISMLHKSQSDRIMVNSTSSLRTPWAARWLPKVLKVRKFFRS